MDEDGEIHAEAAQAISNAADAKDEAIDMRAPQTEPKRRKQHLWIQRQIHL
jgi:hypothetical protein